MYKEMLFNTTENSNEVQEIIDDCLGRPFSFFQSLKLKGVFSKKLMVQSVSKKFNKMLNKVSDISSSTIELRPNGIVIYLKKKNEHYTWAIPYKQLLINRSPRFRIYAQGGFIEFRNNEKFQKNNKFISKMIQLKTECQTKQDFDGYEHFFNTLHYVEEQM